MAESAEDFAAKLVIDIVRDVRNMRRDVVANATKEVQKRDAELRAALLPPDARTIIAKILDVPACADLDREDMARAILSALGAK